MRRRSGFSSLFRKRSVLVAISALFVLALVGVVLEKSKITNLYTKDSDTHEQETEKTTSNTTTAQEEFTDGEYREAGNSLSENEGSAEISDTNGTIDSSIDTTNPITSSTGEISIFAPRPNSIIKSGTTISGSSSLPRVSFRIIDSVTGMIATGELNVTNGKFSGKLTCSTTANEGRIDIFGTRDDLSEFSNVSLDVRFEK